MKVMTISTTQKGKKGDTAFFRNGKFGPAGIARVTKYIESRGEKVIIASKDVIIATGLIVTDKV